MLIPCEDLNGKTTGCTVKDVKHDPEQRQAIRENEERASHLMGRILGPQKWTTESERKSRLRLEQDEIIRQNLNRKRV